MCMLVIQGKFFHAIVAARAARGGSFERNRGLGGRMPSSSCMHKKKQEFVICAKAVGAGRALQRISFFLQLQLKVYCLHDFLIFAQHPGLCSIS